MKKAPGISKLIRQAIDHLESALKYLEAPVDRVDASDDLMIAHSRIQEARGDLSNWIRLDPAAGLRQRGVFTVTAKPSEDLRAPTPNQLVKRARRTK